jgi:integrin beta 3
VTLILLGSLPGFFLIKYVTRDPGFRAMDALELPAWAARNPVDQAIGSRWCLRMCRIRHREWESRQAPQSTVEAYQEALRRQNWTRWEVHGCPPKRVRGDYTCWRRDAYTLDLWVRTPECDGDTEDGQCPEAMVTVVVRNAGDDHRLQ